VLVALATKATFDMRAYHLTSSLVPVFLLLGSCTLNSIDPDTLDVVDEGLTDEVGEADDVGETGDTNGDGDGDATESTSEGTTGDESDSGFDTGDTTGDGDDSTDTTDTADTTDASDAGTGGACEDVPTQGECSECLSTECCDQVLACIADEVCNCYYECLDDDPICGEAECGVANDLVADLLACAGDSTCDVCN
jgi:hypothetical protein